MDENELEVDYGQVSDLYDNLVYAVDSVYVWERSTEPTSVSNAMVALTGCFDCLQTELDEYLETLRNDVENVWLSVKTMIDVDTDVTEYIRTKMCTGFSQDVYRDELNEE